ncbi:MAG: acyltransferase [Lachnospiraceae bacterium]
MTTVEYKRNSLDFLRLFAALQVLLGHYYLFYRGLPQNPMPLMNWFPGVLIFFTISGFLACASLENSSTPLEYLKKRFIRILPPYWICVILNAVVILIIYPVYPSLKDSVIFCLTTIFAFHITPNYLNGYASGSTNGSLWSIFVILQFYVVILLIHPVIKKWNQLKYLLLIAFFMLINILCGYLSRFVLPEALSSLMGRTFIPYFYIVLIGTYLYTFRDKVIPLLVKYWYLITGIYLAGCLFNVQGYLTVWFYCDPFTGILVPLITFALAYRLGSHRIKHEFSYGIFLYHFAVMNVLIHFQFPKDSPFVLVTLLLVSCLLATLSLFFIEKPMESLIKRKLRV